MVCLHYTPTTPLSSPTHCSLPVDQQAAEASNRRENLQGEKMGETLRDGIGLDYKIINPAASLAIKAHKSSGNLFLLEKPVDLSVAIFAFSGCWVLDDWYAQAPFGETKIDTGVFPSLRSLGIGEVARVNASFLRRFKDIISRSELVEKLNQVIAEGKQVVFAGHSSGGAVAVLATLQLLEKLEPNQSQPRCITFGSPLVGDRIFGHALRREKWADCFIHFVMKYDVVPRIMLSPSFHNTEEILSYFQFKSKSSARPNNPLSGCFTGCFRERIDPPSGFYLTVMTAASSVSSYDACNMIGFKAMETLGNFIEVSPYRPFGTYIFLPGNGKLVVVRNPDAVLQILFHSAQLGDAEVERRSLDQHFAYKNELKKSLERQSVYYLNREQLEMLPSSADDNRARDLSLSQQARLCLRIAGEWENQRLKNMGQINEYMERTVVELGKLRKYKENAENYGRGYYDSFKRHEKEEDFLANVSRLVLAGIWDDIKEMLKGYELPDEFEKEKKIVELGTQYRRLVEPLDIANFYRHSKDEETGRYMKDGTRPKRYRFIQSWLEHDKKKPRGSCLESCFWAEVEYLRIKTRKKNEFSEETRQQVHQLEKNLIAWTEEKLLGKDVMCSKSTFVEWYWKDLRSDYKSEAARIDHLIRGSN